MIHFWFDIRKFQYPFLEVGNNSFLTFTDNKMYQPKASTNRTETGSMKLKPEKYFSYTCN